MQGVYKNKPAHLKANIFALKMCRPIVLTLYFFKVTTAFSLSLDENTIVAAHEQSHVQLQVEP